MVLFHDGLVSKSTTKYNRKAPEWKRCGRRLKINIKTTRNEKKGEMGAVFSLSGSDLVAGSSTKGNNPSDFVNGAFLYQLNNY